MGGGQIDGRGRRRHDQAGQLLVLQRRQSPGRGRQEMRRIDGDVREGQERAKQPMAIIANRSAATAAGAEAWRTAPQNQMAVASRLSCISQ
jgi:hypothetical protein